MGNERDQFDEMATEAILDWRKTRPRDDATADGMLEESFSRLLRQQAAKSSKPAEQYDAFTETYFALATGMPVPLPPPAESTIKLVAAARDKIQRYDLVYISGGHGAGRSMEKSDNGDWVDYDDHATALARARQGEQEEVARGLEAASNCVRLGTNPESTPSDARGSTPASRAACEYAYPLMVGIRNETLAPFIASGLADPVTGKPVWWRSIVTAPKDGTDIIALSVDHGRHVCHIAHWSGGGGEEQPRYGPAWFRWMSTLFAEIDPAPRFWMPLFIPAQAAAQENPQ